MFGGFKKFRVFFYRRTVFPGKSVFGRYFLFHLQLLLFESKLKASKCFIFSSVCLFRQTFVLEIICFVIDPCLELVNLVRDL